MPFMAKALTTAGIEVDVATTDDDGPGRRTHASAGPHAQEGGWSARYFPKQTEFYKVSLPLRRWARANVRDYQIVHVHGVFSHACIAASHAARKSDVPYIIRPLGVLNRWGMDNRRRWLKRASFRMLDRPMLEHAAAIHYTSDEEMNEAARLHLRPRPVVIPLGIEEEAFAALPDAGRFHEKFCESRGRRVLLFMSRLHPKKGVEPLLETLALLMPRFADLHLVLAGEGEAAYVAELRAKVMELGLGHQITWAGFLEGEMKRAAFAAAEIFVLPSFSENFGIALLEALAAGLPCVATPEVALAKDVLKHDASCLCLESNTPAQLAAALTGLLEEPDRARQMGLAAKQIAHDHFSMQSMAAGLVKLYSECLDR